MLRVLPLNVAAPEVPVVVRVMGDWRPREEVATAESVPPADDTRPLPRPVKATVPVAVRLPEESEPSKYPFPATESFAKGEVVPMPMLPSETAEPVPVTPVP